MISQPRISVPGLLVVAAYIHAAQLPTPLSPPTGKGAVEGTTQDIAFQVKNVLPGSTSSNGDVLETHRISMDEDSFYSLDESELLGNWIPPAPIQRLYISNPTKGSLWIEEIPDGELNQGENEISNETLVSWNSAYKLRYRAGEHQYGTGFAKIAYILEDSGGNRFEGNLAIDIHPVNDFPTIYPPTRSSTLEDTPLELEIEGSDPDGDEIQLSAVVQTGEVSVLIDGLHLTVVPRRDWYGQAILNLVETDGKGGVDVGVVNVEVLPENDPPTLHIIPGQTGNPGQMHSIPLSATDRDGDKLQFFVEIIQGEIMAFINGARLDWKCPKTWSGNAKAVVTVRDGNGGTSTQTIEFQWQSKNSHPEIQAIDDQIIDEDTNLQLGLVAKDPDGDPLTFFAESDLVDLQLSLAGNQLEISPPPDWYGEAEIKVKANDGKGGSDKTYFKLVAKEVNDPPGLPQLYDLWNRMESTLESQPSQLNTREKGGTRPLVMAEDSTRSIVLPGNDKEGDTLEYTVEVQSGDIGVTLTGTRLELQPALDWYGEAEVKLTAMDGRGGEDTQTMQVTVTPVNDNPRIPDLPALEMEEDRRGTVQLATQDSEGENISYQAFVAKGNAKAAVDANGRLVIRPEKDWNGLGNLTLVATDGNGGVGVQQVQFQVAPANDPPSSILVSSTQVLENQGKGTQVGQIFVRDPDLGDSHTLTLANLADFPDNHAFQLTGESLETALQFNFEEKPQYRLGLLATDTGGMVHTSEITIQIGDANDPPTDILFDYAAPEEAFNTGQMVGKFTAVDPDASDHFQFFLHTSGKDGKSTTSAFEIQDNHLYAVNDIDFEQTPEISLEVTVVDQDGASLSKAFQVQAARQFIPLLDTGLAVENGEGQYEVTGQLLHSGFDAVLEQGVIFGQKAALVLGKESLGIEFSSPADRTIQVTLEGLAPGRPYYYRTFATNGQGTAYGPEKSFTTADPPLPSIFEKAVDIGAGWYSLEGFGLFYVQSQWIFHEGLGWLYVGNNQDQLWLWNKRLGWLWTREDIFPYLWLQDRQAWLYLMPTSGGNLTLYNANTGQLEQYPAI